nr:transposase [Natranaerobius trueperi]
MKGFSDAIHAVYPSAEIQSCIIHQIRNSTKCISYKDRKEFCNDLKNVYRAPTEEVALTELDNLEEKWGSKYEISIRSWRDNWDKLSAMFKIPKKLEN